MITFTKTIKEVDDAAKVTWSVKITHQTLRGAEFAPWNPEHSDGHILTIDGADVYLHSMYTSEVIGHTSFFVWGRWSNSDNDEMVMDDEELQNFTAVVADYNRRYAAYLGLQIHQDGEVDHPSDGDRDE